MLFRASTDLIMEAPEGLLRLHTDDYFRCESSYLVTEGHACKLTPDEVKEVCGEYVEFEKEIFD